MISYAQNFEDVMLRRVFRDRKTGFYIDVGAADPVVDSVTKFFYDEGWSGINIEPNPSLYEKLVKDRARDVNLNVAVGEVEGQKEFYIFENIGSSTFIEANRDHYMALGHESRPVTVQVTTLKAVCEQYARAPIDFLKVDCEGWEGSVLRSGDWDRFRPTVLVIEATLPGTQTPAWQDWEPFLLDHARYQMVYFDGLNRFYLANEAAHFRSCFDLPPNVFDDYNLYALERAHVAMHALELQLADASEQLRAMQEQIAQLEAERAQAEEQRIKLRQWVGRLSQELALRSKQRES